MSGAVPLHPVYASIAWREETCPVPILFTHQQMHYLLNLEMFKIYIKIHTKCRSYMFRSTTIIRELVLNLDKVIFILKHSVKLHRYMLFGDVAACTQHILCSMTCCHITK
jgi:hypothetical protein